MGAPHGIAAARRALLLEAAAGVGQGLLAPFSGLARHRPLRRAELRTVVFVHGLWGTRAGFFPLQAWLAAAGVRRQLAHGYPTFGSRRRTGSLEAMAVALRRRIDAEVRGGRIDVVAHSMGGLVARVWIQLLGGHRRVDRLITLATPHHGTELAAFLPGALGRQLRPDAEILERLSGAPWPGSLALTSIVAGRDTIVRPPRSAAAPIGRVVELHDLGHGAVLFSPRVFNAVHDALLAPGMPRDLSSRATQTVDL